MALLRPVHSLVGAGYDVLVHGHDVLCTARDCVCVTRGTSFPLRDSKLCALSNIPPLKNSTNMLLTALYYRMLISLCLPFL